MTFKGSINQYVEEWGDDLRIASLWWTADGSGNVDADLEGL